MVKTILQLIQNNCGMDVEEVGRKDDVLILRKTEKTLPDPFERPERHGNCMV